MSHHALTLAALVVSGVLFASSGAAFLLKVSAVVTSVFTAAVVPRPPSIATPRSKIYGRAPGDRPLRDEPRVRLLIVLPKPIFT